MNFDTVSSKIGTAVTYGEKDIFTALHFAIKNEFHAVEINLNIPEFFPENYGKEDRKRIKDFVDKKGIRLSFHAPEDISLYHLHKKVREAGLERMKECIDFAYETGGRTITLHPGDPVGLTLPDRKIDLMEVYPSQFVSLLKESLIILREYARDKVLLCIENTAVFNPIIVNVLENLLPQGNLYLTWDVRLCENTF